MMTKTRHICSCKFILVVSAFLLITVAAVPPADAETVPPNKAANHVDDLLKSESDSPPPTKPAKRLDEYGFLRRASLDITGHLPTLTQIESFVADQDPDKRVELVERLLDDPRYGANWAAFWRDVVMYRRTEDRAIPSVLSMERYLTKAFNKNTPWDAIARSFITAEGDIRENGQTAVIALQGGRPEESVAELSRVFLGVQIQCAQCHDHPTDRWTREQFHELAAFFPRTFMRPQRNGGQRTFLVKSRDFALRRKPRADRHFGELEHFMPDLDDPAAEGTAMEPVFFVTGQRLESGAPDEDRRYALAEWMTSPENEWFAKALVNRIWTELIGHGFYDQVDDLGPDRSPRNAEALDYLANQFVASGHNLKWLFRTITSTNTYHRRSLTRDEDQEVAMTVPLQQRLRADQLLNAMIQLLAFESPALAERLKRMGGVGAGQRRRAGFSVVFGYDPSEPRDDVSGSVPQALMLMNGQVIDRLVSARRRDGSFARLLRDTTNDEELTKEFYLRAFTRMPTRRELAAVKKHIRTADSRGEAYEDLLWALLNSSEFIHRG